MSVALAGTNLMKPVFVSGAHDNAKHEPPWPRLAAHAGLIAHHLHMCTCKVHCIMCV